MNERWSEENEVNLRQMESEMSGDLREFRDAAKVLADRAWARGNLPAARRTARQSGWRAWAAAGLAAVAIGGIGVRVAHHPAAAGVTRGVPMANVPVVRVQEASAVSDEKLLEQIQSDLSSGVPAAMEPLQAADAKSGRQVLRRGE